MTPEITSEMIKRYLVSAGITFATGFALIVLPELENIDMETLKDGSLIGLLFAGVRAGIKAVVEMVMARYNA